MKTKISLSIFLVFSTMLAFGASFTQKVNWSAYSSDGEEGILAMDGGSGSYGGYPYATMVLPRNSRFDMFDTSLGRLESVSINFVTTNAALATIQGVNIGDVTMSNIDMVTQMSFVLGSQYSPMYRSPNETGDVEGMDFLTLIQSEQAFNLDGPEFSLICDFYGTDLEYFTQSGQATLGIYNQLLLTYGYKNPNYGNPDDITSFIEISMTAASGYYEVIYNYTPIPESSTYAAILGVLALGFVTYRRKHA